MSKTLSSLQPGESGVVEKLDVSSEVQAKLLELGIIPGETVRLIRRAPMGDPIEIELLGFRLALRVSEASRILLT
jgi:Fe2+ transport system protein FeoA